MSNIKVAYHKFALLFSGLLSLVLCVCANTTSCAMVHQPEAPDALKRYSKIK